MAFFKKNIDFGQFVGDAILGSVNFYETNADKLIAMADELKVLEENDMTELKELGYSLVIADLMTSCQINLNNKVSNEEIGEAFSFLYARFLGEVKHLTKKEIEPRMQTLIKLIGESEKNGDSPMSDRIKNSSASEEEKFQILLCSTFAQMYSGENLRDKKVEGKKFVAFKLAKAFVKANLIKTILKDFKIQV